MGVTDGLAVDELSRALDARKVAIFGASASPDKMGHLVAADLLQRGYQGEVVLINPSGGEILGHPMTGNVDAAADADLAVLWTPGPVAVDLIPTCAALRIPMVIVGGNGFREVGDLDAEQRLLEVARQHGVRLLGPNTMGIDVPATGLFLSLNPDAPAGDISLVSQSGGIVQMVGLRLEALGAGFDAVIPVGNKADVGFTECLRVLMERPSTKSILIYIEDCDEGDEFFATLTEASSKMSVVVLIGARTAAGVSAARSHTGSMLSDSARLEGMIESTGAYVAHSLPEACAVAARGPRLRSRQLQRPGRVLVIADGGAAAVMQANALHDSGHELSAVGAQLTDNLALLGRTASNPLDLAGAADGDLGVVTALVDGALRDDAHDAIVLAIPFGIYADMGPQWSAGEVAAAEGIAALAAIHETPIVVWSPVATRGRSPALDLLRANGIPCLEWPEEVSTVLSAALHGRRGRRPHRQAHGAETSAVWDPLLSIETDRILEAFERYAVPSAVGRKVTLSDCAAITDGSWVLRLDGFAHKTNIGAVKVGISSGDLTKHYEELANLAQRLEAPETIRLAPFFPHDTELLATFWRDPRQGSGCALGAGGIHTEEKSDVAVGTMPRTEEDVRQLLGQSDVGQHVLTHERAQEAIDVILRLAVVFTDALDTRELECNPVALGAEGVCVLDVLPS